MKSSSRPSIADALTAPLPSRCRTCARTDLVEQIDLWLEAREKGTTDWGLGRVYAWLRENDFNPPAQSTLVHHVKRCRAEQWGRIGGR